MKAQQYVKIMALLNAIVRCFNENVGKIDLTALSQPLAAIGGNSAVMHAPEIKKNLRELL